MRCRQHGRSREVVRGFNELLELRDVVVLALIADFPFVGLDVRVDDARQARITRFHNAIRADIELLPIQHSEARRNRRCQWDSTCKSHRVALWHHDMLGRFDVRCPGTCKVLCLGQPSQTSALWLVWSGIAVTKVCCSCKGVYQNTVGCQGIFVPCSEGA